MRLGLVAILGSGLGLRWLGVGVMGHIVESEYKAQMGLGITMSYISSPLIRARFSRTNQGIQDTIAIWEALWVDMGWFRNPLMCFQKVCSTWLFGLAVIIT